MTQHKGMAGHSGKVAKNRKSQVAERLEKTMEHKKAAMALFEHLDSNREEREEEREEEDDDS